MTPLSRFSPREQAWLHASVARLLRLPAPSREARYDREGLRSLPSIAELTQKLLDGRMGRGVRTLTEAECGVLRAALRAVRSDGPDPDFARDVSGLSPLDSTHVTSLLIRLGG